MRLERLIQKFAACATLACAATAMAHHSYSMFDTSRQLTVSGIVAKHEWRNPHAYLWVYVASSSGSTKYEAWGFENGSPSVLMTMGWGKQSVRPGDKVTVVYSPLRGGKPGGHCLKVTLPDGRSLECVGFAPGPGR